MAKSVTVPGKCCAISDGDWAVVQIIKVSVSGV